MVVLLRRF